MSRLAALVVALFTTLRDRFLTGSLTGSFLVQSNDWFPVPSPTGTGTGRTGSSRGSSDQESHATTHPITPTRKDIPMTDTQPSIHDRLEAATGLNGDTLRGQLADQGLTVVVDETITDPAQIRATDEPDERGDLPCCATPAPVSGAGLDLDAMARRYSTATDDEVIYEMYPALEAEACRLTARSLAAESVILDQRRMSADHDAFCRPATDRLVARAEAAEAEVVTLWAKVAAVEAKRDEFADLLARALPAVAALARVEALCDSNPDHADTCGSMLTPGAGYPCSCWQADLRAALATTGEGQ